MRTKCENYHKFWHYLGIPGTIRKWIWSNWAKLALFRSGFGPNLGQVGIIQRWIWVKITQNWHYPKVDLAQKLSKLTLSYMLALSKGGLGPNVVNPRNYRSFQGWIWTSIAQRSQHFYANLAYLLAVWNPWEEGGRFLMKYGSKTIFRLDRLLL